MDKAIKYLGIGITDKKRFFRLNPNWGLIVYQNLNSELYMILK